ncbi:MAG TPA: SGNH/GDSL hydrolase family protein [Actinomycetaceae bacterium]|nr:SGNH/GDSL hydrolase family protein [Actinomycetaceae bacterium]
MPGLRPVSAVWRLVAIALLAVVAFGLAFAALAQSRSAPAASESTGPSGAAAAGAAADGAAPSQASLSPAEAQTGTGGAAEDPAPAGPRVAVLGDRYSMDSAWPQILRDEHGWDVVNLSEDGMGYISAPASCAAEPCTNFRGQIERVAASDPEIVVLFGGEADGDLALPEFAVPTLTNLQAAVPNAQILVATPASAQSPWPYWLMMHVQSLREVAGETGVTYVDTTDVVGVAASYADGNLTPEANSALAEIFAAGTD